jgi:hypothetical protein
VEGGGVEGRGGPHVIGSSGCPSAEIGEDGHLSRNGKLVCNYNGKKGFESGARHAEEEAFPPFLPRPASLTD